MTINTALITVIGDENKQKKHFTGWFLHNNNKELKAHIWLHMFNRENQYYLCATHAQVTYIILLLKLKLADSYR